MIKKLTKHGNSMALVIDRPILELLKIDVETPLDISTDSQVLIISPVHDEKRREKLKKPWIRQTENMAVCSSDWQSD